MNRKIIFWGATGQSQVLHEIVSDQGFELIALFENNVEVESPIAGVPIYYSQKGFDRWWLETGSMVSDLWCLIAIGGDRGRDRLEIQRMLEEKGIKPATALHQTAFVAQNASLGKGVQILANSSVCVNSRVGDGCIVNTGAIVEHGVFLSDGVHIGPGAIVTGEVFVGEYSFVGAGAVILPRLKIGANTIVGAGAVVTKDIPDNYVVSGNPAKKHKK